MNLPGFRRTKLSSQGRIEVARTWAANGQASTSLSATFTQMEGVCSDNNRVVGFLNAWCLWDSSMAALGGTPVYCTQCGKGSNHLHKYKGRRAETLGDGRSRLEGKRTCNSDIRDRQKQKESQRHVKVPRAG